MYVTAWCVEVVTGTVFAGVSSTFCQPDSRGMQLPRQPLSRHYRATAEECGPATSPVWVSSCVCWCWDGEGNRRGSAFVFYLCMCHCVCVFYVCVCMWVRFLCVFSMYMCVRVCAFPVCVFYIYVCACVCVSCVCVCVCVCVWERERERGVEERCEGMIKYIFVLVIVLYVVVSWEMV